MQWIGSICGRLRLLVFANFEATSTDHMPGSSPGTPCTALVKNRTSRFARFAANYTYMWYLVGNSYQNVGYTLYAIHYTPTDWKVVNTLSYTLFNIYIMVHLLCAEEYRFIWVTVMECRSALKSTCTEYYGRRLLPLCSHRYEKH